MTNKNCTWLIAVILLLYASFTSLQLFSQNLVVLSQDYLYAAKTEGDSESHKNQLRNLSMVDLQSALQNDAEKKAFWLNLYNASILDALKKNPDLYKNRNAFYSYKILKFKDFEISLDQIEHDILRKGKYKYSLGYFNKIMTSKFTRLLQVDSLDNRIHFALNCGAKSCPAIAFYSAENIDYELYISTQTFLRDDINLQGNTLEISRIFHWFRGDFQGKKGTIQFLKKYSIIEEDAKPKIKYRKYDWTLEVNNYQ